MTERRLYYFERCEKKVDVAVRFLNNLKDSAEKQGKINLKNSIEKVLEEIRKI